LRELLLLVLHAHVRNHIVLRLQYLTELIRRSFYFFVKGCFAYRLCKVHIAETDYIISREV